MNEIRFIKILINIFTKNKNTNNENNNYRLFKRAMPLVEQDQAQEERFWKVTSKGLTSWKH